jgi:GNAT superfamily N-acetyltransferase
MEPRVRRATAEDAHEIASVQVASWRAGYAEVFPAEFLAGLSVDERVELWTRVLSDGCFDIFVAERDGRVSGFASAGPTEDDDGAGTRGELFALYVEPSAWGRGLGRALLARAEAALREAGFDEATLWVLEDNPRARAVYAAAGWREDGGRYRLTEPDVGADAIRYRKGLDRARLAAPDRGPRRDT